MYMINIYTYIYSNCSLLQHRIATRASSKEPYTSAKAPYIFSKKSYTILTCSVLQRRIATRLTQGHMVIDNILDYSRHLKHC